MKKTFTKLSFVLLAVTVLLFFLHWLNVSRPVENAMARIISPVQSAFYAAGRRVGRLADPWFLKKNLAEENAGLKNRVEKLVLENAGLKALEEENSILRENLNFFRQRDYGFVLADIVGESAGVIGKKIFILNRGEEEGIKVGYAAMVAPAENSPDDRLNGLEGFLVGKIIKTDKNSSMLLLLTDSQSNAAAAVHGEKEVSGLVKGKDGLAMQMDFIPADEKITVGNLIITSGLEINIPKGLVIGEIENIDFKAGEFFQKAVVKPIISFGNLKILAILIPRSSN